MLHAPRPRRVFLHIGRNKTGSTAVQVALSENRERLVDLGFDYPGNALDHAAIVYSMSKRALEQLPEAAREANIAAAAALRDSIHTHDRDVILSSEGLSNIHPKLIMEWLDGIDATIVVYIREQVEYLASAYQQAVKGDLETGTFEEYAGRFSVDYYEILTRWERFFKRKRMIVRTYDRSRLIGGDVVSDFLATIGISDFAAFTGRPDRNPSVRGAMIEAKRILNGTGFGFQEMLYGVYRALLALANEREEFRGMIGVDPAFVAEQRARYQESNRAVAERYLGRDDLFTLRDIPPARAFEAEEIRDAMTTLLDRARLDSPEFVDEARRRLPAALVDRVET